MAIIDDNFPKGLALAPWNVLAAGRIRTDAEEERRRQTGENGRSMHGPWERSEAERKVCHALEQVAKEIGAKSITSGEQKIRAFYLLSTMMLKSWS